MAFFIAYFPSPDYCKNSLKAIDSYKEITVIQIRLTALFISALLSTASQAATVYVSDIQFIAIREGLNNNTTAVERGLKSGTPLEVLIQNNGYSKVRTPSGNEGWVADYFLSNNQVTRNQLNELQASIKRITTDRNNIVQQLKANMQASQQQSALNTALQSQNAALKEQIKNDAQLSKQAQNIVIQNKDISYQIESLKQQVKSAQTQVQKQQKTTEQKWFMIGAATLLSGLLLGLFASAIRRTKNGSWS